MPRTASVFHFQLKIPHHKPTLRNNMSSISYGKFGDTLPMTSIVALSQAAVGFGLGLLLAGKLDQTVRQRTAIAFIGAGAATILPFVAGIIADLNNRPDSSRRIRRQLASIREGHWSLERRRRLLLNSEHTNFRDAETPDLVGSLFDGNRTAVDSRADLILASSSARRQALLQDAGVDFQVEAARIEESTGEGMTARELCLFNARLKATEVASRFPHRIVLGADTVVSLEGSRLRQAG